MPWGVRGTLERKETVRGAKSPETPLSARAKGARVTRGATKREGQPSWFSVVGLTERGCVLRGYQQALRPGSQGPGSAGGQRIPWSTSGVCVDDFGGGGLGAGGRGGGKDRGAKVGS